MNRERYSFCFLRYHHDPLSGEFANVGVLLWAPDSSFLGFRCSKKFARLICREIYASAFDVAPVKKVISAQGLRKGQGSSAIIPSGGIGGGRRSGRLCPRP